MAASCTPKWRDTWYGPGALASCGYPTNQLGHHPNSAGTRVINYLAYLALGVVEAVRTQSLQFWKAEAFDAEALVVGQMPVKDVQLDGCHAVQGAQDDWDRFKMARTVNQQTAPSKAWLIGNGDCGKDVSARLFLDKLK
jgi:hypothetical protein